jgi:hypothetical protein
VLIDQGNITRFQEKAAAAIYSAICAIAGTVVNIFGPATIGIFGRVRKVNMTFWQPVRIRHIHARRSGKQNV